MRRMHDRLGIDLGRHRSFLTVDDGSGTEVVRLSPHHEGLLLRVAQPQGPSRRPVDVLAGSTDHVAFVTLASRALSMVVAPAPRVDPGTLGLAVPSTFGRRARTWLMDAAGVAGLRPERTRLVGRSEAALAAWLAQQREGRRPRDLVLSVDVDGGACTATAAHLGPGAVLASTDLGLHLHPATASVEVPDGLRRLVGATAVLARPRPQPLAWTAVASRVAVVVTSGTGAGHPLLSSVLSALFPASDIVPALAEPELAVAAGLVNLDVLRGVRILGPVPSGPQPVHHVQPQLGRQPQRLDVDALVVTVEAAEELTGPH